MKRRMYNKVLKRNAESKVLEQLIVTGGEPSNGESKTLRSFSHFIVNEIGVQNALENFSAKVVNSIEEFLQVLKLSDLMYDNSYPNRNNIELTEDRAIFSTKDITFGTLKQRKYKDGTSFSDETEGNFDTNQFSIVLIECHEYYDNGTNEHSDYEYTLYLYSPKNVK